MYLQELSDKIWKTKNARFMAAHRMHRSRISSMVSVALLSATIIAVNMLAFMDVSNKEKTQITIVTIILSTFALVMSLLINMLRYEYREDNYQQCGCELENLNQRLKIRIAELQQADVLESPKEANTSFLGEYNAILRRFNLNHTDFDYHYSLIKAEKNEQNGKLHRHWYWVRWNFWDVSFLYWLIAVVPMLAVLWYFIYGN